MKGMPERVAAFAEEHESIWKAFTLLAEECHQGGPLDEKTRRLIKLALALGAGMEGGTHSAVRHALAAGCTQEELEHVVILGITTLGWPTSFRNITWVRDELATQARLQQPPVADRT